MGRNQEGISLHHRLVIRPGRMIGRSDADDVVSEGLVFCFVAHHPARQDDCITSQDDGQDDGQDDAKMARMIAKEAG